MYEYIKKEYIKNNKAKVKQQKKITDKNYQDKNKESIRLNKKQYYIENKEFFKQKSKEHREDNLEYYKDYNKKYQQNPKHQAKRNKQRTLRYNTDINFKIKTTLRNKLNQVLKNNSKHKSALELLGCTVEELKTHLQSQFVEGMTWDNHGTGFYGKKQWHIDHIKPCIKFDLSKKSEQIKCFHYTNLQPLWAKDNLSKGRTNFNLS